jgi:hypothetical protein
MTYSDIPNATFSPESAGGPSLSLSRAGLQLNLFGLDPVPVSHSHAQVPSVAPTTNATCGPCSASSSASAALQTSLASRLQAHLAGIGSPEYDLTWKDWAMQSGPPICALRASGRRISANGFTGWPTSRAEDSESTGAHHGRPDTLTSAARQAGWPTPNTNNVKGAYQDDAKNLARREAGRQVNLQDVARLAGWPTVCATEARQGYQDRTTGKQGTQESLTTVALKNTPPPDARMAFSEHTGLEGHTGHEHDRNQPRRLDTEQARPITPSGDLGFWSDSEFIPCRDGLARRVPTEPALFPMADGIPGRVGLLRGAGNAIVPPLAARFIEAVMATID